MRQNSLFCNTESLFCRLVGEWMSVPYYRIVRDLMWLVVHPASRNKKVTVRERRYRELSWSAKQTLAETILFSSIIMWHAGRYCGRRRCACAKYSNLSYAVRFIMWAKRRNKISHVLVDRTFVDSLSIKGVFQFSRNRTLCRSGAKEVRSPFTRD